MVNGKGLRVSLFVSGCDINCNGCFNKKSQNFKFGQLFTNNDLNTILNYLNNPAITGLSILGGEPLHPKNINTIYSIVKIIKLTYPNKDIWIWTGYLYEDLIKLPLNKEIFNLIDVLIDGPFIQELKTKTSQWRGSSNQRVIQLN